MTSIPTARVNLDHRDQVELVIDIDDVEEVTEYCIVVYHYVTCISLSIYSFITLSIYHLSMTTS